MLWNDGTELYHYGILGMKWGVRRYQNEDGTYTEEGLRRKRREQNGEGSRSSKRVSISPNAKRAAVIALGAIGAMAVTAAIIKNEQTYKKVSGILDDASYWTDTADKYNKAVENWSKLLLSEKDQLRNTRGELNEYRDYIRRGGAINSFGKKQFEDAKKSFNTDMSIAKNAIKNRASDARTRDIARSIARDKLNDAKPYDRFGRYIIRYNKKHGTTFGY